MMFVRIFIAVCAFAILFTVAFGQENRWPARADAGFMASPTQADIQIDTPAAPSVTNSIPPGISPSISDFQQPQATPSQPSANNYLPEAFLVPEPKENSITFEVDQLSRTDVDEATRLATEFAQQARTTGDNNPLPAPAAGPALPESLWDNVSGNFVLPTMDRLVKATESEENLQENLVIRPVLLSLLRHDVSVPNGLTELQWQARRAAWLLELGHAMDAYAILQALPLDTLTQDAVLARTWTTSMLLAGETSRACGFVRQQIMNTRTNFWRQALMTCQLLQQQTDALELSLRLLSPSEKAAHDSFITLLQAALEDVPPAMPALKTRMLSPLAATIYGKYPGFLRYEMLPALPDVILQRIQTTQALPLPLRTHAVEILAARYNYAPAVEALPQLYNTFSFDVLTAKDPIGAARAMANGTRARALLWQAAGMADLASLRATSLEALWQRANADKLTGLVHFLQPQLRSIRPQAALAWFAPAAVKAYLHTGEVGQAQAWWQSLQNNTMLSAEITTKRQDLSIVFQYLGKQINPTGFETWWAEQPVADPLVHQRLQQILAVLDASGLQVPRSAWDELYARMDALQQPGPSHLWLRLLAQQLEQNETGGVLLMVLEALQQPYLAPATIANVLTALAYLDMPQLAQKVALYILLQAPEAAAADIEPTKAMMPEISATSAAKAINNEGNSFNASGTTPD